MSFLRVLSFGMVLSIMFCMTGPAEAGSYENSPVGQPITDYKPSGPSPTTTPPPPPPKPYNPQNDPDVQAGWDAHQAKYNK